MEEALQEEDKKAVVSTGDAMEVDDEQQHQQAEPSQLNGQLSTQPSDNDVQMTD
jgi:hypothetical protein